MVYVICDVLCQHLELSENRIQQNPTKHLMNGIDPKYHFCTNTEETIDYLISRCSTLAQNAFKYRHDRIGKYLYWNIYQHYITNVNKRHELKLPPLLGD